MFARKWYRGYKILGSILPHIAHVGKCLQVQNFAPKVPFCIHVHQSARMHARTHAHTHTHTHTNTHTHTHTHTHTLNLPLLISAQF